MPPGRASGTNLRLSGTRLITPWAGSKIGATGLRRSDTPRIPFSNGTLYSGAMDFFRGRARTLADVEGITSVRVVGRLRASTPHTSPFTGRRGAVFGWTFWVNRRRATVPSTLDVIEDALDRNAPSPFGAPSLTLVGDVAWSDGVTVDVEGQSIALPALGVDVAFASGGGDPTPVEVEWPAWLPKPDGIEKGAPYVLERVLLEGDEVELVATIEARPTSHLGTYRGGDAGRELTLRSDREKPRLVERDDPTSLG
ncbi:MAG: hypothetical protein U0235_30040 [Polyangiaceae bacterium]